MIPQLLIGFACGALIAFLAWRVGALSRSGAWAAALTGGVIFGSGGLAWAALLLTFFISSSLLSRLFANRKAAVNEKFSKGSRRDWGQVFANGGLGAILAMAYWSSAHQNWIWIAFVGAMAAVNADTWATELGILNPTAPRLITTGKSVEKGTSGGISLLGTLSALAGAALVGVVAALFSLATGAFGIIFIASLSGLAGSLFDSLLGATVQAIYYCPACQKETERHPLHTCGTQTVRVRGWPWLNNDLVNFACSSAGALSAIGLWLVLAGAN
jgi:uncharacterized protein (TIGR00297 family)